MKKHLLFFLLLLTACPLFSSEEEKPELLIISQIKSLTNTNKKIASYLKLAEIYIKDGETDKAIDVYNDALSNSPDKKTGYSIFISMGDIELRRSQYAASIEYYKRAGDIYPGREEVRIRLAKAYEASDLLNFAEDEYRKALRSRENSFEGNFGIAKLYYRQGFYTQAMDHLKKALDRRPNAQVYHYAGLCARRINDANLAISLFKQAVSLEPRYEGYMNLGGLYEEKKMPDDAEKAYSLAIKTSPDEKEAYLRLGMLYTGTKDFTEAENMFKIALEKDPQSGLVHFFFGVMYQKAGQTALAKKELELSAKLTGSELVRNYIDCNFK